MERARGDMSSFKTMAIDTATADPQPCEPVTVAFPANMRHTVKTYRDLIAFFDTLSIILVLFTLAVQCQSSYVHNPTKLKVPWPNNIYVPWLMANLLGFGCGVVGAVKSKPSLVGVAFILSVADLILFLVHGRGTHALTLLAIPTILAHFSFLSLYWVHFVRSKKHGTLHAEANVDPDGAERNLKIFARSLWMQRGIIIVDNVYLIALVFRSLSASTSSSDNNKQGLPLSPFVHVVWLTGSVVGRVAGMVGVAKNKIWLVYIAMIGIYVDLLFYLFRGNSLMEGEQAAGELGALLLIFYTIFLTFLGVQQTLQDIASGGQDHVRAALTESSHNSETILT